VSFLTDPQDAHFWIAIALVVFLAILWRAKAPGMVGKALDDAGARIQAQLDEAARLRDEARDLLAQIVERRAQSEHAAAEMLKTAQADAARLRDEAAADLEGDILRRRALAERRIALAETQAAAGVKAAAADLAAAGAQAVLAARIAGAKTDPLIDAGLEGLGKRFS